MIFPRKISPSLRLYNWIAPLNCSAHHKFGRFRICSDYCRTMKLFTPLTLPRYNQTVRVLYQTQERQWFGHFLFTSSETHKEFKRLLLFHLLKGYYFSPQELRIITDGRCGSACSKFIKRTSELKPTKIISLCANLLANNPH